MKLSEIDNKTLLIKTQELARNEREITLSVLHHLREIERRHLYAELGFSSLYEYAVQELKYSNGAAHRRIASMRLLDTLPEMEKKLESGVLSLCALAQAQTFFRQEKTESLEVKKSILSNLENKSTREVERELLSCSSHPEKLMPEKLRPVTQTLTELKILVDEKLLKEIEELRGIMAHRNPHASIKEVLAFAVTKALERVRPKAPKGLAPALEVKDPQTKNSQSNTRYISQEVKRRVWQRDKGQCTFEGAERRCTSKHGLEFDHIQPFAMGGSSTEENLRLRCRAHNQLEAIKVLGHKKMAAYLPRMREGVS